MNPTLNRAIRRILLAGAATALTAGTMSMAHAFNAGVQTTPPGPGQMPDYFGVSSNYATSPTPNFVQVSIAGAGTGAVAAATTVDYLSPNYGLSPAGNYSGDLLDVQLASGGSGYVAGATTATVTGYDNTGAATSVSLTPIVTAGVIVGFAEIPHAAALTDDNNVLYPAWQTDTTSGQWLLQIYDGTSWTQVGVDGAGPYWGGVTQTYAGANVNAGSFSQPIPGTGLRKFVDQVSLPGQTNNLGQTLTIANPGVYTNPFTGADYYEIAEVAYTQQMHSDLPPTHLRGYIQLVPSTAAGAIALSTANFPNVQLDASVDGKYYVLGGPSYLGPVIVAQKNKAVRIKAHNLLPTGAAGALPFPVDHTYMGAGKQDNTGLLSSGEPDNRTAIHLHGGTTPWISDGTPRQWFTPAGEVEQRGVSATDVPDMWFDASGNLLPNSATCTQGTTTCTTPGATNYPGPGALTFFYTNEQSSRLMFYHDHAEGTTRLNVYAGLAAGYILRDDTEQAMTVGNPTTVANNGQVYSQVLPADEIPLIIQEKTFRPDNTKPVMTFYGPFRSQLNAQDPTWRWGSSDTSWDGISNGPVTFPGQFAGTTVVPATANRLAGVTYANGTGDLWVPHVYMTNQNPGDVSGANPQGRWDYGAWFWPPATGTIHKQVTNPYYDASCNSANITNPVGTCEFQYVPGFPNGGQMPSAANVLTRTEANGTVTNLNSTTAVNCTFTQNGKGTSVKSCSPTGAVSAAELTALSEASGTPEAFNDTSVVNGTAYPYMNVDPKKYRLRILSVGNDRSLNLSMWVAASKNAADTTSAANGGATPAGAPDTTLCNGINALTAAECTEVRMVPWSLDQNTARKFPAWWYSPLKGGVTFDGRPGGVPDPATRGPAMVQIGTEGGFLAEPAVIKNQPVNYEYNVKNILVTNVKEHALLLGAAERADVVVDFSQFAGSTIILYNDAPAPQPAWDLRLDYFTGNFDNTDTGGTFQTVPGYGPNTRTVMQFRVNATCTTASCGTGINRAPATSHPVDDVDSTWLASTTTEVRKAFKFSQESIVVPQAAYNGAYGTNVADVVSGNLSAIGDSALNYVPYTLDANGNVVANPVAPEAAITLPMEPKAIQELFTLEYGRMNATLGVEIPNTTATTQTTIPMGYVEPPTELVQMTKDNPNMVIGGSIGQLADGTQIWKITHNGVDTHPVHFHLFSVQLINRVGWDGAIYNPEPNEVGWKEVLRMNPLSDVIVALRPKTLTLPFKLGNSHHLADATQADGSTANQPNLSPLGGGSNVVNRVLNYGWEYVWHCHILGHEENDFMRSIAVAQIPEDPTMGAFTANIDGTNTVTWTDNSVNSNWVTIERSTDAGFAAGTITSFDVANPTTGDYNAYGECTNQAGCARTWNDATPPVGSVYYRVMAKSTVGAGDTYNLLPAVVKNLVLPTGSNNSKGFTGYNNVTANSNYSGVSSGAALQPAATLSSTALTFNQALNTTSAPQIVTLTNTGKANLSFTSVVLSDTVNYAMVNNGCTGSLSPNASCNVSVTFKPTSALVNPILATIDFTDSATPATQSVALTGNVLAPTAGLAPTSLAFGNQAARSTSAAKSVTLTNSGNANLTISNIAFSAGGFFTRPAGNVGTCPTAFPATLAAGASCTVNVVFVPGNTTPPATGTLRTGTLTVTDNSSTGTTQTVALSGTAINAAYANITPVGPLSFSSLIGVQSANQTITVRNDGIATLTGSFAITGPFNRNGGTCPAGTISLTNGGSCTIVVRYLPTAAGTATGAVTFTTNSNAVSPATSTQVVNLTGTAPLAVAKTGTGTLTSTVAGGTLAFGNANGLTTATLTFTNSTGAPVFFGALAVTNAAGQTAFSKGTDSCINRNIAAGATCSVTVNFNGPAGNSARTGTLTVPYTLNGTTQPQTFSLSGS